jgi:DNA-binding transcriptional ArsR family regulator
MRTRQPIRAEGGRESAPTPLFRKAVEERKTIRSTAARDAATESAVLQLVLALHPSPLTFGELVRELGADLDDEARDAVTRAVRDLEGAGLVHRHAETVVPTRAALRFDQLMER